MWKGIIANKLCMVFKRKEKRNIPPRTGDSGIAWFYTVKKDKRNMGTMEKTPEKPIHPGLARGICCIIVQLITIYIEQGGVGVLEQFT